MITSRSAVVLAIALLFMQCERRFVEVPPTTSVSSASGLSGITASVKSGFDATADLNVLFIGNSLTYENDLPLLVKEIAAMDGVKMGITSITAGGFSLDDHWVQGQVQKELADHDYNFAVGQQGPSALPESQALLRAAAVKLAEECRKHGTKPALYGVWPTLQRAFDRDASIASYANAAIASNSRICPAGAAWKLAWADDPAMPLYGPDDFHPSAHGSMLAAMVVYASLKEKTDLDFMKKDDLRWGSIITNAQFTIMKRAAIAASRM